MKKNPTANLKNLPEAPAAAWDSLFGAKKAEGETQQMNPGAAQPFVPGGQNAAASFEDDAIVSMSSQSTKPTFSNKGKQQKNNNQGADFIDNPDAKQTKRGGHRELKKTDWLQGSSVSGTQLGVGLADLEKEEGSFDQFKDRKTTYHDNLYNSVINENEFSQAQKDFAIKMEKEISGTSTSNTHLAEERGQLRFGTDKDQNEELMFSGVERREVKNPKKFHTNNVANKNDSFVSRLDKIVSSHIEKDSINKMGILSNQWVEIQKRH